MPRLGARPRAELQLSAGDPPLSRPAPRPPQPPRPVAAEARTRRPPLQRILEPLRPVKRPLRPPPPPTRPGGDVVEVPGRTLAGPARRFLRPAVLLVLPRRLRPLGPGPHGPRPCPSAPAVEKTPGHPLLPSIPPAGDRPQPLSLFPSPRSNVCLLYYQVLYPTPSIPHGCLSGEPISGDYFSTCAFPVIGRRTSIPGPSRQ